MRRIKPLLLFTMILGTSALVFGENATTGDRNLNNDKPDYFYYEEDWLAVPTTPASNLQVINFKANEWKLTSQQKEQLRTLVNRVRKNGAVQEAYVAAYADEVRAGNKDLPRAEQKLARHRARSVRDFLEDSFGIDVTTYNMAARPGWWARLWNTEKAKVQGTGNTSGDWVADLLRSNAKASSVSVVLTTRNESKNLSE